MTVSPIVRKDEIDGVRRVLCVCGAEMQPEVGRSLTPDGGVWLWWRCMENARHVTRSLPIPDEMSEVRPQV